MAEPSNVVMAAAMSVASCGCGSIYVRFHGPDGTIFAVGGMGADTALALTENLADEIAKVFEGQACKCASEAVH